jgi:hypothetical protein
VVSFTRGRHHHRSLGYNSALDKLDEVNRGIKLEVPKGKVMKRLGYRKDGYCFLDIRCFKHRAHGSMGSRRARKISKIIARAEKRGERQKSLEID